jgi:hypothetical protein
MIRRVAALMMLGGGSVRLGQPFSVCIFANYVHQMELNACHD